jgi:uncharacterized phage protein (TIGR02220 family)
MKRFTETNKWGDVWFRKLSPSAKLLWQWLCDNCDAAGVIEPDYELAAFQIGLAMGMDTLSEIGDRVKTLDNRKILLVKFVEFQYGELSIDCRGHNPVFTSLQKHGLELVSGANGKKNTVQQIKGIHTHSLGSRTGQDRTGQDNGDSKGEIYSPESRVALHFLNEKSGKHFRESATSLAPINARLQEDGVDIAGVRQMIARQCQMWKDTRMQEYLRPETLFGKEKFNSYYASKDLPVSFEDRKQPELVQQGF